MHLAIYDDADVFENDNGEERQEQKASLMVLLRRWRGSATYIFDLPEGV